MEPLDEPVVVGGRFGQHRLHARAPVDVGDGGDHPPLRLLHGDDQRHEARRVLPPRVGQVEEPRHVLDEGRGRERPVRLAELDLGVDHVLHLRAPGIGENAALTQRARAPLEAPPRPADDATGGEAVDDPIDQGVVVVERLIADAALAKELEHLPRAVVPPPRRVLHHEAPRLAQDDVMGPEGGPQRAAPVAGGRLHVELLERRLPQQAAVGDAVEGDPAGQTELPEPGPLVEISRHPQQNLLGDGLHAGRDVGITLIGLGP